MFVGMWIPYAAAVRLKQTNARYALDLMFVFETGRFRFKNPRALFPIEMMLSYHNAGSILILIVW